MGLIFNPFTGSFEFPSSGSGGGASGEYSFGTTGSAATIDFSKGSVIVATLNAATPALTLSNGVDGSFYILKLAQDMTGGRAPTFVTTVDWGTNGAPTLSTAGSKVDYLGLYVDGSGNWHGLGAILGFNG